MGTVLVRGGGGLSVLKPDMAYPGDLADDTQWVSVPDRHSHWDGFSTKLLLAGECVELTGDTHDF
jgi:hypothetical protein